MTTIQIGEEEYPEVLAALDMGAKILRITNDEVGADAWNDLAAVLRDRWLDAYFTQKGWEVTHANE